MGFWNLAEIWRFIWNSLVVLGFHIGFWDLLGFCDSFRILGFCTRFWDLIWKFEIYSGIWELVGILGFRMRFWDF